MLTSWALIPFTAFVTNLALAAYALHAGLRHPVNRMFALVTGLLAWWALLTTVYHIVVDPAAYNLAVCMAAPVWIFIGPLTLHMVLVVLREGPLLRDHPWYLLAYAPGVPLLLLRWFTDSLYVVDPEMKPWGFSQTPGSLLVLYYVYIQTFAVFALGLLIYHTWRAREAILRRRLLCLTVGTGIPLVGGITTNIILPLLGITVYWAAVGMTSIMAIFFAVGIYRYRLLQPTLRRSASQVLRTMSQPVILLNPSGTILEANEAAQAISEKSSMDFIGLPVTTLLQGGGRAWQALLDARDGDGQVANHEAELLTTDGAAMPMLLSLTTLWGRGETVEGFLLLGADVSELKAAQRAVQESEELYRTLYEDSVEGVVLAWRTIRAANKRVGEILGCPADELVGRKLSDFWPDVQPDGRPSLEAARHWRDATLTGEPQFFVWQLRRPDGALVDCEMSMNAVSVDGEQLLQMSLRDVTEQRRLEEAMQYLHGATASVVGDDFFRGLAQHLSQWLGLSWVQIGELDPHAPDTICSLVVWHGSAPGEPLCYELTGTPCADAVASGFQYFAAGVAALYPQDAIFQELGMESYVGVPLHDDHGQAIGLICAFDQHPLRVPAEIVETVFTLVATRVSAELVRLRAEAQEREHAARLRELQKTESIAMLAGGVAHDFNNILVGVLGHASLAREALPPDSPAQHSLNVIEDSAERAVGLTSQLLAYARGGQQTPEPVNLRGVVVELLEMLEAVLPKSVNVQCMLPDDLPPVLADPSQMQQVVMNLCTNAGEAMGETGGLLTVRLGVEQGSAHCADTGRPSADAYVVLTVSDTGCGIDAQTQQRMFEPFFSTKEFGRGLGLSAAVGIVLNHGGCLHCDSTPGFGTTFTARLPAHAGAAEAAAGPEAPAPACANGAETILVVDDEPLVSDFAVEVLARLGYRVLNAATGEEALAIYRDRPADIDLVLMDLIMPGADGLATMEAMRDVNPDVRVILSSGYGADQFPGGANGASPTIFLKKPYRSRTLAEAVRQALAA